MHKEPPSADEDVLFVDEPPLFAHEDLAFVDKEPLIVDEELRFVDTEPITPVERDGAPTGEATAPLRFAFLVE